MTICPHNDYILCRQVQSQSYSSNIGNFQLKQENVPIYEIIGIPSTLDNFRYTLGDYIISNSTGSKIHLESDDQYLIDIHTIIAKIEKD